MNIGLRDAATGCPERMLTPPESSARVNRLYDMAEELRGLHLFMEDSAYFKETLRGAYLEAYALYLNEMEQDTPA